MISLLSEIVTRSATQSPDHAAFRCRDSEITYRELDQRSTELAGQLQSYGVVKGDRVAIYMPKALEMAVGVYACLKTGAIYVPIDPTLPPERLRTVLDDAGVAAIITIERQRQQLLTVVPQLACVLRVVVGLEPTDGIETPVIDWDDIADSPPFVAPDLSNDDAAYIIYTSGSTGAPKGILHTHRSGMAYATKAAELYGLVGEDRLGNFAPLHFDQSTFDFFAGPLVAATTVMIPEEHMRFPASLAKLIDDERLSVWYSVPFALVHLLNRGAVEARDLSSLRWVLYGGEPFPVDDLRRLMKRLPHAVFSNVYGPAEVNQCTFFHLEEPPGEDVPAIPIGAVWDAAAGLIVDTDDRPTVVGEIGELLINSDTMMTAYWNQPSLTKSSMCERECDGEVRRFFRTGDLVRERHDGVLEFHGRRDRQVKIRGNRVELDEVEAVLSGSPAVQEAAAFAILDTTTDSFTVVATIILKGNDPEVDAKTILAAARAQLPVYAAPTAIVFAESLPRTTSDKTDYGALLSQWQSRSVYQGQLS